MKELGASQGQSHWDFGNVIASFSCSSKPPKIPEIKFSGLCSIKAAGRAWVSWAGMAWPGSTGLPKEQLASGACRCPGGDGGSQGAGQTKEYVHSSRLDAVCVTSAHILLVQTGPLVAKPNDNRVRIIFTWWEACQESRVQILVDKQCNPSLEGVEILAVKEG